MEFTVQQIAEVLRGEVRGDHLQKVYRLAKIQEAQPGEIAFLSNLKYEPFAYTTQATALIISRDFVPKQAISASLIVVEDAYTAFSQLLEEYQKLTLNEKQGIEQPSYLAATATHGEGLYLGAFAYVGQRVRLGQHVKIYPQAYIGDNVTIGDHTVVYAGAKIYADTQIGRHCTIHAGAVIGSDGFGFAPQPDGSYRTVPQVGNVILEDFVDIGANTTIDRATMGHTVVEQGAKLDNLIQIAHNVRVGRHTVIAAQSGVSGSTELGPNCVVAGQVGIIGHLKIAEGTTIAAQSGVGKSVTKPGSTLQGSPAFEHRDSLKSYVLYRKLPELVARLEALEKMAKAQPPA
ncbi:MAG: UDP-3-O-(3-hydroxymyristoyl)glucosamine N-acyltransferase [Bernardetiaceae bacterium]|jgi:UDP-3-O-[3-hydroxymyristoyl] glucosamine N-acyltransferase|nr:UDP-3-O-(3-hydroxymyristoyl)glucosamine N-acyltransferase [Bernardetiaceae bacterium]